MAQLDVVIKAVDASRAGITSFNRRIDQTTDKIGGVSRTSKVAAGAVAGLAAVGVGAFANLAGKALQVADNVDKMNRTTGLSTTFIQGLAHAADQSGTSIEAVNKGFLRATRVLADAERGLKTSEDALAKIGFTTEDLAGLKPDELFRKLADGVAGVEDPTKRAAVAQEVFGRAGAELIPLLEGGAAGVDAFVKEAQGLGIVLDEGAIRASAEFNDKLDVLKKQGLALVQRALADLLPVLTSVVDFLSENAVEAVVALGGALGVLTAVAMPAFIASIKAMTAALLANPIGLVIAALVALGAGLFIAWRKSETFRNIVTGAFEAVMGVVRKVVSSMLDRLAGLIEGIASIASMFTWLPGPVGDAMEKVRDALNRAAHALRGWADTVDGKLEEAEAAYSHFANHIRRFEADTKKNLDGFAEGAANMSDEFVRHLDVMVLNTQEFADNQRRAFEAHYEGLTMLRRQHELTERIERQAHLRAMQTGFAKQFADAQRDRAIGLQRWAAGTSEFHRQMEADTEEFHRKINKSAKQSTEKQLSESERLAQGLLVSMTNACGAVTGFQQCVDGVVVEFDANMKRIVKSTEEAELTVLTKSERLALGMAVAVRDSCGAITGFEKCVDGMKQTYTASGEIILSDAEKLSRGLLVTARDQCGAITGFSGCVAGMERSWDKTGRRILSDAERLQSGLAVRMTDACGSVTGFEKCVNGVKVTFNKDGRQIVSEADMFQAGLVRPITNACGTITGFEKCVDGATVAFDKDGQQIISDADKFQAGLVRPITNACGTITGFEKCVDGVKVEFDKDGLEIVKDGEEHFGQLQLTVEEKTGEAARKALEAWGEMSDGAGETFERLQLTVEEKTGEAARKALEAWSGLRLGTREMLGRMGDEVDSAFTRLKRRTEAFMKEMRLSSQEMKDASTKSITLATRAVDRDATHIQTTDGKVIENPHFWTPNQRREYWEGVRVRYEKRGIDTTKVEKILSEIPALARGGIVTQPTLAMIGEAGPEAVLPLNNMRGSDRPLTVVLELDGSRLGEAVVSNVNKAAREGTLLLSGSYDA